MFYKNTGWYNDYVTKDLKGLLVYPEHRYFGTSMPFGADSYNQENLKYLTIEQATFDYIELIKAFKD